MNPCPKNVETEHYYRRISALGKEAMRKKRADGEAMHKAPLGYLNSRDAEGRSVLMLDPDVLPLVEEARRLRAEGHSVRTIRRVMTSKGLRGRSGGPVSVAGLWKLLRDR